jgi:hypothetical protein
MKEGMNGGDLTARCATMRQCTHMHSSSNLKLVGKRFALTEVDGKHVQMSLTATANAIKNETLNIAMWQYF